MRRRSAFWLAAAAAFMAAVGTPGGCRVAIGNWPEEFPPKPDK